MTGRPGKPRPEQDQIGGRFNGGSPSPRVSVARGAGQPAPQTDGHRPARDTEPGLRAALGPQPSFRVQVRLKPVCQTEQSGNSSLKKGRGNATYCGPVANLASSQRSRQHVEILPLAWSTVALPSVSLLWPSIERTSYGRQPTKCLRREVARVVIVRYPSENHRPPSAPR